MAAEPLIDFDQLDLSKTVVTKAQALEVLKQRGTFEMVDGLLHFEPGSGLVVGYLASTPQPGEFAAVHHLRAPQYRTSGEKLARTELRLAWH